MISAFQTQWTRDLMPMWDEVPAAKFIWMSKDQKPDDTMWWAVFFDDSDQADALAYHDLTDTGMPISKIFARTVQNEGVSLTISASHEFCEMALDPYLQLVFVDAQGVSWAGENADPVEDDAYGYRINGIWVSDFIGPAWFGEAGTNDRLDFMGYCKKPFEVMSGGYAQKQLKGQQDWIQVNGELVQRSSIDGHKLSPPVGSRRERRTRYPDHKRSERWKAGHSSTD